MFVGCLKICFLFAFMFGRRDAISNRLGGLRMMGAWGGHRAQGSLREDVAAVAADYATCRQTEHHGGSVAAHNTLELGIYLIRYLMLVNKQLQPTLLVKPSSRWLQGREAFNIAFLVETQLSLNRRLSTFWKAPSVYSRS